MCIWRQRSEGVGPKAAPWLRESEPHFWDSQSQGGSGMLTAWPTMVHTNCPPRWPHLSLCSTPSQVAAYPSHLAPLFGNQNCPEAMSDKPCASLEAQTATLLPPKEPHPYSSGKADCFCPVPAYSLGRGHSLSCTKCEVSFSHIHSFCISEADGFVVIWAQAVTSRTIKNAFFWILVENTVCFL